MFQLHWEMVSDKTLRRVADQNFDPGPMANTAFRILKEVRDVTFKEISDGIGSVGAGTNTDSSACVEG